LKEISVLDLVYLGLAASCFAAFAVYAILLDRL
jgi:hypothetical protein